MLCWEFNENLRKDSFDLHFNSNYSPAHWNRKMSCRIQFQWSKQTTRWFSWVPSQSSGWLRTPWTECCGSMGSPTLLCPQTPSILFATSTLEHPLYWTLGSFSGKYNRKQFQKSTSTVSSWNSTCIHQHTEQWKLNMHPRREASRDKLRLHLGWGST